MFKNDIDGQMIASQNHPKVQAIERALQQFRGNMEDAPVATIKVKLPIEVESDPATWTKTFNRKNDGNVIVFIRFIRKVLKNEKYVKIEII